LFYVFFCVLWRNLRIKLILKSSDDGVLLHFKESCFWTLSIVQCFLKNTTFRKLDLFPSSGKIKVAPTLLGPLERASLNHWIEAGRWPKSKSTNVSTCTSVLTSSQRPRFPLTPHFHKANPSVCFKWNLRGWWGTTKAFRVPSWNKSVITDECVHIWYNLIYNIKAHS
jgi:hypothetical protein